MQRVVPLQRDRSDIMGWRWLHGPYNLVVFVVVELDILELLHCACGAPRHHEAHHQPQGCHPSHCAGHTLLGQGPSTQRTTQNGKESDGSCLGHGQQLLVTELCSLADAAVGGVLCPTVLLETGERGVSQAQITTQHSGHNKAGNAVAGLAQAIVSKWANKWIGGEH